MENTFFALKVAFCYEMDQVCKALGSDYNEVRDLWLLDPRNNSSHTGVMETNLIPFGGKCLPKDVNGLVKRAQEYGYEPELLKEILASNNRIGGLRGAKEFDY